VLTAFPPNVAYTWILGGLTLLLREGRGGKEEDKGRAERVKRKG